MLSNDVIFHRPRDEHKEDHSSSDAIWMRNKAFIDENINQNSNKPLQISNAEKAVLERLAKRQGYSYLNQGQTPTNLPSTMSAYYKSEWYAIKKKQQENAHMDALDRANEQLINAIIPSYVTIAINAKSSNSIIPPIKTHDTLTRKVEREKEIQAAIEQEKKKLLIQEQNRSALEEKRRQEKIAIQRKQRQKEEEKKKKAAEEAEEQKRLNREASLQKQKEILEKRKEQVPISKHIDEQLERKVKEQYRPPKEPKPPVSKEEFEKAQREKAQRESDIRLAKQRAEKLHQDEIERKAEQLHRDEVERKAALDKKEKNIIQRRFIGTLTPELREAQRKSDLASQQLDHIFKKEADLYKTRTELPSIYIILLCFNESVMLPLTVGHYRAQFPSCEIIIYDNESSDNSVMIAKELGCHVISWSSNQINDEILKIKIRNHCWRHIEEGWIIMADMDEWIYITENELKQEEENGTSILSIEGMEMVGESQTLDFSDINLNEIKRYIPFIEESKNLCFFRTKISSMNFGPGSHKCMPIGTVVFSTPVYQLRHMCNIGLPFLLHKMKQRYERSALNRSKGMSIHYTADEKKITDKYNKLLSQSISL